MWWEMDRNKGMKQSVARKQQLGKGRRKGDREYRQDKVGGKDKIQKQKSHLSLSSCFPSKPSY